MVQFKKHKKPISVELIVLKDPELVMWIINIAKNIEHMQKIRDETKRLLIKFDKKPIGVNCSAVTCSCKATRFTVYGGDLVPNWWCDNCEPYHYGGSSGALKIIRTYFDAMAHVTLWCSGRKSDREELIKIMAQAKGLPSRVGEKQAAAFF